MAVVYIDKSGEFQPYQHRTEADFEKVIKALADNIFGPTSNYLDIKRKVKGREIVSIPDGYVIDLVDSRNPRLYVVENEISTHDAFRHIGSQMLRFVVSFDDAKKEIRELLMTELQTKPEYLKRLEVACASSESRNIDNYLDSAVFGPFRGVVLIDEIQPELNRVLEKINANISVLEVRTYASETGEYCYHYDTLYDEGDEGIRATEYVAEVVTSEERVRRRENRAKCDTIVVPAREDGFKEVFLGEDRWYAIRIGAAMKDRIKFIAGYQVAPISAVTHIAEIKEIKPYEDSGKYQVIFQGPAKEVSPIGLNETRYKPQGPVYVRYDDLVKAKHLDEALAALAK